jgi:hypothetical protein
LTKFEKKARREEEKQKKIEKEGWKELQEQILANAKDTKEEILPEDMLQLPSGAMISKESI